LLIEIFLLRFKIWGFLKNLSNGCGLDILWGQSLNLLILASFIIYPSVLFFFLSLHSAWNGMAKNIPTIIPNVNENAIINPPCSLCAPVCIFSAASTNNAPSVYPALNEKTRIFRIIIQFVAKKLVVSQALTMNIPKCKNLSTIST